MASVGTTQISLPPQPSQPVSSLSPNQRTIAEVRENKGAFLGVAISQIAFGVFCIGLGIASLILCGADGVYCVYDIPGGYDYYGTLNEVSAGIWGGALAIVFGSFGASATCKPTVCKVVVYFILSICGIVLSLIMMGIEIGAAAATDRKASLITTHSITVGFSFILLILFIVSATYSGTAKGYCKDCYSDEVATQPEPYVIPTGTTGFVTLPNGQVVLIEGDVHRSISPSILTQSSESIILGHPQESKQFSQGNQLNNVASPPDYNTINTDPTRSTPSEGVANPEFQNEYPTKF